ncbi:hypothetical protein AAU61_21055 [Desulfocarbo indianensis]|nr:hypothetical protein AAU61_21055 [Desulfocarbo indianensis]
MLCAGIDVGAKTVKIVAVLDGRMVDKVIAPAGRDAAAALAQAWQELGAEYQKPERVIATGMGQAGVKMAHGFVSEAAAAAQGVKALHPQARFVVEVGAEEGRAVKISEDGKAADSALNEKCAAGAGAFAESMARALEVSLEEFAEMSLKSTDKVAMNAQCAVFAESELVGLLHANTPKGDIAQAVHDAIAERIVSLVRRLGLAEPAALIGGLARNQGFVHSLNLGLKTQVIVPQEPEFVAALGAALLGAAGDFAESPQPREGR